MSKEIRSVIGLVNNGKSFPAVSLVKNHPEIAATISKLVHSRLPPVFDPDGTKSAYNINRGNLQQISANVIEKTEDSESIMQLFPDMELGSQILISSIISPKDMSSTEVIYTAPNTMLSSEVSASLISRIKDYNEKEYKLKNLLPKILREALFVTGSYVLAVIPESSIDEMINGPGKIGLESISDYLTPQGHVVNYGILGDPREKPEKPFGSVMSMESFYEYKMQPSYDSGLTTTEGDKEKRVIKSFIGSHVNVIDNFHILKLPRVFDKIKKQRMSDILQSKSKNSLAFESKITKLNDSQMQTLIYKSKERGTIPLVKVKTQDQVLRSTVGKPLILKLPSESVIPVHVPGNEQEHIGFFVLIDGEGNPVSKSSNTNHFGDLQSRINNQSNSMSSYLLQRARNSIVSPDCTALSLDQASRVYSDIVESDLLQRLRTGQPGSNVEIAKNEEVYRIMLARTFANQTTQLLYIPAELVTYFAYKYSKNGIGKSLHDDMRILNSLRAMMMFSRVMASLKNSIGRTEVKLKLSENDVDPQKSIETAVHEIVKTRQQYFPLGLNSPVDLVEWVQRSGFEFTFEGHPKIPDMNIEFNEKNTNFTKPDTELDEDLAKRAIMGFGLSPETVDNGFASEFATTIVSNNILLAKRVVQIQEHIAPLLTDHIRKIIKNDGNLIADLKDIIKENYEKIKKAIDKKENTDFDMGEDQGDIVNYLLNNFVNSLELGLPQPNSITLENQMASFDSYVEALDKCLDAWINEEIVNSNMSGEIANNVGSIKAIVKAHYLRKYMAENNILPELAEMTTMDENGNPALNLFESQTNHINGLVRSFVNLFKGTKPMAEAADKDLNKLTEGAGLDDTNSSDSTDTESTDDFGGDMDMDMGMDEPAGGDDDVPADLPPLNEAE